MKHIKLKFYKLLRWITNIDKKFNEMEFNRLEKRMLWIEKHLKRLGGKL